MAKKIDREQNCCGLSITTTDGNQLCFIEAVQVSNSAQVLNTLVGRSKEDWHSDAHIGSRLLKKLDKVHAFRVNYCTDGVELGDKSPAEIQHIAAAMIPGDAR